jgi:H+/Cl- antiporter ClcA
VRVRRFTRIGTMESWMLAGSAAGLAAAFNTPLGGIVYAIEELASKHFSRVRTTVLTSVLVSGLVSQWLVGSYLYLGFPRIGKVTFAVIPVAFAIGIGGGLIGGVFGNMLFRGRGVLERRLRGRRAVIGLVIAVICGFALVGLRFIDARALGPGNRLISNILSGETTGSALLVLVRMGSTIVSYMSGNSGGVFAPALAVGAGLGSWVASWWTGTNAVLLSLLGMIAVLTGLTRTPFTAFVLILEMTDRHSAIFPMMLTAIVAFGSARLVGGASFYEHTKQSMLRALARERRAARRGEAEAAAAPTAAPIPG